MGEGHGHAVEHLGLDLAGPLQQRLIVRLDLAWTFTMDAAHIRASDGTTPDHAYGERRCLWAWQLNLEHFHLSTRKICSDNRDHFICPVLPNF